LPFFKKTNCLSLSFFLVCTAILGLLVSSCCHNKTIPQLNYPLHLTYAQFADDLYTGDIILFHGDTEFDKVTDSIVRSPWAHVGMIIKDKKQNTYLWEATVKSNAKDVIDHTTKNGPQLVLLKDRLINDVTIKDHSGWAYRKLEVSDELRASFGTTLKQITEIEHPKDLPSAVRVFLDASLGRYLHIKTSEKKIFCSELIVLTYMQMGLVSEDAIPNGYDPKDFSSDSNKLKFLQKDTRLLKEQYFKPVMKEGVLSVRLASD
jgi:hypothetical protein